MAATNTATKTAARAKEDETKMLTKAEASSLDLAEPGFRLAARKADLLAQAR
jgi:hypothetical protein